MTKKLQAQLIADFPTLFRKPLPFGIECGDGWEPLIRRCCRDIIEDKDFQMMFTQIKEKFGALRMYCSQGQLDSYQTIDQTEAASRHVCEMCGAEGKVLVSETGWWKCVCPECAGGKYKEPKPFKN